MEVVRKKPEHISIKSTHFKKYSQVHKEIGANEKLYDMHIDPGTVTILNDIEHADFMRNAKKKREQEGSGDVDAFSLFGGAKRDTPKEGPTKA